jgi:hypothetical protein
MTSEIDKLKHFHIKDYSGTNFTDDLNDGEEFLYTTSDYTHLFGYLNPYYRSAYNVSKRRK